MNELKVPTLVIIGTTARWKQKFLFLKL